MKSSLVLLLIVVLNNNLLSNSSPIGNTECNVNFTVSDVIQKKCSNSNVNITKNGQLKLDDCPKWCDLKQIESVSEQNEKAIQCILYANSLISFCTAVNTSLLAAKLEFQNEFNIENVCSKLLEPLENAEFNIQKIIRNERICMKLCTTYDSSGVAKECSSAYYFASFVNSKDASTVHKPVVNVDPPHKEESDTKAANPAEAISSVDIMDKHQTKQAQQTVNEQKSVALQGKDVQQTVDQQIPSAKQSHISAQSNVGQHSVDTQQLVTKDKSVPQPRKEQPEPSKTSNIQSTSDQKAVSDVVGFREAGNVQSSKKVANLPETAYVQESPNVAESPKVQSSVVGVQETDHQDVPKNEGRMEEEDEEGVIPKYEEPSVNDTPKDVVLPDNEETNTNNDDDYIDNMRAEVTKVKEKPAEGPISFSNMDNMDGESSFFTYFMVVCVLFVLGYVVYHNRQKVLALVLEGKRGKRQYRRRPNSANYHKLDSNLEEAISSSCNKNSSHVIY